MAGVDKRSRVAQRAALVSAFVGIAVVVGGCKEKDVSAEIAAEDQACANKDVAACKRRSARLLALCETTKNGWLCVRGADTVTAYEGGKAALPHYDRACELSNTVGCTRAAAIWATLGDRDKARGYFEKACAKKDSFACDELGRCHLGGTPEEPTLCDRDLVKAKSYFEKACEVRRIAPPDCENATMVDALKKKK